jgi:hypothetical protein
MQSSPNVKLQQRMGFIRASWLGSFSTWREGLMKPGRHSKGTVESTAIALATARPTRERRT